MKTVMFVIGSINGKGGIERITTLISNQLHKRGYRVIILTLFDDPNPFFCLTKEIRIISLNAQKPENKMSKIHILKRAKKINEFACENSVDTIVGVGVPINLYGYLVKKKNKNIKWISWEHENFWFNKTYFVKIMRRLAAKRADHIVLLSQDDADCFKKYFKPKNNCIKINNMCEAGNTEGKVYENIILSAGRLWNVKQFDKLIEAWAIIENKYPDWMVMIAGEGSERPFLEGLIEKNGLKRIRLLGLQSNMSELYLKASIYVSTSTFEGFSLVVAESQCHGLPAVCFKCEGGLSEIVQEGINGYFVPQGEVRMLADKLETLINNRDLLLSMGENAKKLSNRFSYDNILNEWEKIL